MRLRRCELAAIKCRRVASEASHHRFSMFPIGNFLRALSGVIGAMRRVKRKYAGIYKMMCRSEGAVYVYVGKSNDLLQRYHQHQYSLRQNSHNNPKMQELYNKYGPQSFEFEVIELCADEDSLETREVFWIQALQPDINIVNTKLSVNDVRNIKLLISQGIGLLEVCDRYNLSLKYLKEVLRGDKWK